MNNYNTMNNNNNNNNNNNDNTMDESINDSTKNDNIDSSSVIMAEAVLLSTPAQKHQPGTANALYKLAARNLREYHGVPSMTALKLEKTVALLGLAPRRMVVQGLAPRRLLKGGKGGSSPLASAGEIPEEGEKELRGAETGELMMYGNPINNNDSSSEDQEEEEEVGQEDILFSDDSNSTYDDNGDSIDNIDDKTKNGAEDSKPNRNGKAKRPIHAALVARGINVRPRETRPLLRALGVSPHRLVKLGLVKREAVRAMPGRRGGGAGQHLRAGGPRKGGMGRPRGPPHGPPHALSGPSPGGGHRGMHLGEESEEEGMSAPLSPHGSPGHRGPRHHAGHLPGPPNGPGHHNMPTGRYGRGPPGGSKHGPGHGRGPPGGGKHGHGHRHPPHGHGHGHDSGGLHGEREREGGERLRGGRAHGPGQHGPRLHGGGMGRPRGPPDAKTGAHYCCGPSSGCGPSRPMHGPPRRPFHGAGHHTTHAGGESEEEGMPAPLGPLGGPEHRGPRQRHHGGRGLGRSRGRPQGPPQGPIHGPFRGLFREHASGVPLGIMAHPHHGSPSRGGCGMKQRSARHGGGMGYCGGGGGVGGGGGRERHHGMAHLAHFYGRHQLQLQAY